MFDRKIEGQGHEEQRGIFHHCVANSVAYNLFEKVAGLF